MGGPLAGVKVVELAGRGPGPFGAMLLADLGAEVVRVCRVSDVDVSGEAPEGGIARMINGRRQIDLVTRGRRSVAVDLKHPDGLCVVRRLVSQADVFVEGFRPGVAERLGIGPSVCLELNPRLVYAQITGWGQDGPYAHTPGHDINYVALAGALDPLRRRDGSPPAPPLNLLGDYGGGGMLLAVGVLAALVERQRSGLGQVVDAAMVDGSALLTTFIYGLRAGGAWRDERGVNLLDGGAPFYDTYATADGGHVAVGAIEPKFYAELLAGLGLSDVGLPAQMDVSGWPVLRERFTRAFASRGRDEWAAVFEGTDACVAPVLSPAEAGDHRHNQARMVFTEICGVRQPTPAPRFSRSKTSLPAAPAQPGADVDGVLGGSGPWALGLGPKRLASLRAAGVIG